ncbi:ABC transporter substrate-binding protein [Paenibacillus alvei]|uniref:ABC transporter substrate-binding protein n=1 Tax=Paenibacillus alvei TaxID=44250 RepID=A0A383RFY7_PAEAL|nr:ABC transporter substrate-binding protein [Paenibacillus alvei]SYX85860.1 ABC transporter substrate-binding protein [Paenibacillus alvei]
MSPFSEVSQLLQLDYLALRAYLYEREHERTAVLRLQELEKVWHCSRKNAKRKLHKLVSEYDCTYIPGRGRGNQSEICFVTDFYEDLLDFIYLCLQQQDMEQLLQVLQLPFPRQWIGDLQKPIQEQFGLQPTTVGKDVLHAITTYPVTNLDPAFVSITYDSMLASLIGDTLLRYDADQNELVPHLAIGWEVDEQGLTWTIYLRKQVWFHHHRALTSRDVKFSLERLMHSACPNRWLTRDIASIDCPSPLVARIILHRSNPLFGRYLASTPMIILPEDGKNTDSFFIGTGPYRIVSCQQNRVVLHAFDSYFRERAYMDEIHCWQMPPERAHLIQYDIPCIETVPFNPANDRPTELGYRFAMFNSKHSPTMRDRMLRKALIELLDMETMWEELGRTGLIPASHFFPWRSTLIRKSLTEAKRWLAASSYSGEKLRLYMLDIPEAWEEAAWIQQRALCIGIHIDLHPFSFNDIHDSTNDPHMDIILSGEVSSLDPHLSVLAAFRSEALAFRRYLSDEQLEWIDAQLFLFQHENTEERERRIDRIVQYVVDEACIGFMHHPQHERPIHPMLQHVQYDSFGFADLYHLWTPPLKN